MFDQFLLNLVELSLRMATILVKIKLRCRLQSKEHEPHSCNSYLVSNSFSFMDSPNSVALMVGP